MLTITDDDMTVSFNKYWCDDAPDEITVEVNGEKRTYGIVAECELEMDRRRELNLVFVAPCSVCGSETYFDSMTSFCCNCGAKIVRSEADGQTDQSRT